MSSLAVIDLGSGVTATVITCGFNHNCVITNTASVLKHSFYATFCPKGASAIRLCALVIHCLSTGETTHGASWTWMTGTPLETARGRWGTAWGRPIWEGVTPPLQLWQANITLARSEIPTTWCAGEKMTTTAIDLGTGTNATAIAACYSSTCAIFDTGGVKCWGRNDYGELASGNNIDLGNGSSEMGDSLSVLDFGTGRTAVSITGKGNHFCAVLDNDDIVCWGRNN